MPKSNPSKPRRLICLSNVFDDHYQNARAEKITPSLSAGKRCNLFRCLASATNREVIVLSTHPKALDRRRGRWLPAMETHFDTHKQFFAPNWDVPKLRLPLSWLFYAFHVVWHTQSGDLILIDNYEIVYVLAAWVTRLSRRVRFVLDYEDGKHLIDRSLWRVLSALAEFLAQPLFSAALIAHPNLGRRLKPETPRELVPGFVVRNGNAAAAPKDFVRFLYSGSLDSPRGVDLLLAALPQLPETGWKLEVSGSGPLEKSVSELATEARWNGKVTFHGPISDEAYRRLISVCHVGLNCQKSSDPISNVTFPSKIFTYLSAGLLVISSRASKVEDICGAACLYYDDDTPEALFHVMNEVIADFRNALRKIDTKPVRDQYSVSSTAARLNSMFTQARLL